MRRCQEDCVELFDVLRDERLIAGEQSGDVSGLDEGEVASRVGDAFGEQHRVGDGIQAIGFAGFRSAIPAAERDDAAGLQMRIKDAPGIDGVERIL
jgi:hypothetical protein